MPLACIGYRFHPPPKAIMITPIYDYDVQIGLEESSYPRFADVYSRSANGSWHPRDSFANMRHSAAHAPSLMYYPTDATEYRRGRESFDSDRFHDRRYSHYQRRPMIPSYSRSLTPRSDDRSAYSDSDSFREEGGRRASSHSPTRKLRRRHSPHYEDNRGRGSYPYEEDYSHRYSSYPQSHNRTRERPSDDPIAKRPPNYQTQAMNQTHSAVGHAPSHAPSHGTEHSFGRYSQNTPYPVHPTGSAVSHTGGGRPPTSASGRSPFYPPAEISPSRAGSHFAPSVMGGRVAPSVMSASAAGGFQRNVFDDMVRSYLKLIPPDPEWKPSKLTGRKKAVCVSDIMALL